jgi:tRNA(Arg) A34 adenosine deaminase TadA
MSKVERYFRLAKTIALKGDNRKYRLGAVGIRTDGAIVTASNIPSRQPHAKAHAEARLTKKLNRGSEVFVVRILRSGMLDNAHPCMKCQKAMRLRGVRRAYYSISNDEYGVINFS